MGIQPQQEKELIYHRVLADIEEQMSERLEDDCNILLSLDSDAAANVSN